MEGYWSCSFRTTYTFTLCDRDADLVRKIGEATALEIRATGIHYTFAPCVAVSIINLF
jgi:beta-glucosidase-like glycosyl hydrolase